MVSSDSTIPLRRCTKCGISFPATSEYFHRSKSSAFGLASRCKPCRRKIHREKRILTGKRIPTEEKQRLAELGLKRCSHCKDELPATLEHFTQTKQQKDGLSCWCKTCQHGWRDEKQGYLHEYYQNYYYSNREVILAKRREENFRRREHRKLYNRRYYAANHRALLEQKKDYARRNPEKLRVHWRNMHSKRVKNAAGSHTTEDIELLYRSQKGKCWWCGNAIDFDKCHIDHRIPLARGGSNDARNLCIACPKCNMSKHDKLPQEWNGRLL